MTEKRFNEYEKKIEIITNETAIIRLINGHVDVFLSGNFTDTDLKQIAAVIQELQTEISAEKQAD